MQVLLIPMNMHIHAYVKSGAIGKDVYLSFNGDRDDISYNGKINNMTFKNIYTKFTNGELLVKLDIHNESTTSNYNRVVNVPNISYSENKVVTTEYLGNNKCRDNTTLSENIIFEIMPILNGYNYELRSEVDDPGYVNTHNHLDYSISGTDQELSFFHNEVVEYGTIHDVPPSPMK